MPIPLLFMGIGAITAIAGVGNTIKAGIDQSDANDINEEANDIIEEASKKIDKYRKNSGKAINSLGECKIRVLNESIKPFVEEFEKLNHVELTASTGMNELQKMVLDKSQMKELKQMGSIASSFVGGVATGTLTGVAAAFGAYGFAGTFASASTGTAIASLSGAAATNATLAFFGGGSLAAGGLGMAGGTAVLGGLVAGPALAIMGGVLSSKASANLERARSNKAKANEYKEEMDAAAVACSGIRKRSAMFHRFLLSLNAVFEPLVFEMTQIIERRGTDFRTYSPNEKKTIAEAMAMAGAIKSILDTPILDEEGNLTSESEKIVDVTRKKVEEVIA